MRNVALIVIAVLLVPTGAAAQKGQQIFDLFLQGAQQEIHRQQQRDFERQQRHQLQRLHQQYVQQWQACHNGDIANCDAALTFPHLNTPDRRALYAKRQQILAAEQEAADRAYRQRVEAEADERRRQQREREIADRQRAEETQRTQRPAVLAYVAREEAAEPSSSLWLWIILASIAVMGVALVAFAVRCWPAMVQRNWTAADSPNLPPPIASEQGSGASVDPPQTAPPPIPGTIVRDTPGAVAAMELALAYLEEVRAADRPAADDKVGRKQHLNTLSLATKQLKLAQTLDADAMLEIAGDDGTLRFSVNELKAEALLLEGMTHQVYDTKRAIPALVAATELDPSSARAFYILGLTHAANMSRAKAIAAFEKAVSLDPKNITYRKELNRAQNLSGVEIAAYRAVRTGERVYDNSVQAWNIFAFVWNIVTFPLRVVISVFRLLRLHPF